MHKSDNHFHIRFGNREKLDWECFEIWEDAQRRAQELVLPDETFVIEAVSEDCPLQGRSISARGRAVTEA